jgi:hypothetical protein
LSWFSKRDSSGCFVSAKVPKHYAIRREYRRCNACDISFEVNFSAADDLVPFQDSSSSEIRWMPTYENGGYLDLLELLVPAYSQGDRITHRVSQAFESAFEVIQEKPLSGGMFRIWAVGGCPSCGSCDKIIIESNSILRRPPLTWIRYDLQMGKGERGKGGQDWAVKKLLFGGLRLILLVFLIAAA